MQKFGVFGEGGSSDKQRKEEMIVRKNEARIPDFE